MHPTTGAGLEKEQEFTVDFIHFSRIIPAVLWGADYGKHLSKEFCPVVQEKYPAYFSFSFSQKQLQCSCTPDQKHQEHGHFPNRKWQRKILMLNEMGNTSPLRRAILDNDDSKVERILQEAGEGSPDLINEDYTSDCLCNRSFNIFSERPKLKAQDSDQRLLQNATRAET